MKKPKQLPAVDRNKATKSAAVPLGAGGNVRASFDWASLLQPQAINGFVPTL
jgi:hypothetical protein